jgi:hypothetical protein
LSRPGWVVLRFFLRRGHAQLAHQLRHGVPAHPPPGSAEVGGDPDNLQGIPPAHGLSSHWQPAHALGALPQQAWLRTMT